MGTKYRYICENCGIMHTTFKGQCQKCGEYGCVVENTEPEQNPLAVYTVKKAKTSKNLNPETLSLKRIPTGVKEYDRVIGGGIVPGSTTILTAPPGTGKSTLLSKLSHSTGMEVLYISGEENLSQIMLRNQRIGTVTPHVEIVESNRIKDIEKYGENKQLIIVDSIQAFYNDETKTAPGTPTQVVAVTEQCIDYAKRTGTPMILIAQYTKGGTIAGPNQVAHMVDTILELKKSETNRKILTLTPTKNRFGSLEEIGLFMHTENGFIEIADPTSLIEDTPPETSEHGVALGIVKEQSRMFFIEIQAMTVPNNTPGPPKRQADGLSKNRLELLLAIMQSKGYPTDKMDVYLNVTSGINITGQKTTDLAIIAAIKSAITKTPIPPNQVFWGETMLTGRIKTPDLEAAQKYVHRFGKNIQTKQIL